MSVDYLENYKSFQPCSVATAAELTGDSESEIKDLVLEFLQRYSDTGDLDFLAVSPNHEILFSTPGGVFVWAGDDFYDLVGNSGIVRKYLIARYQKITGFYADEIKKALVAEGASPGSISQRRIEDKGKIVLKVHYRELWNMLMKLNQQGILPGLDSESLPDRLNYSKEAWKNVVQEVANKYQIDVKQYYGNEIGMTGDQKDAHYIEVPFKPI